MRIQMLLAPLLAATMAAACAGNKLDRNFRSGDFTEVARLFEADSALYNDADALYRAGLAYALPESEVHDPERATRLFDRLLALDPSHPQRLHVTHMRQLLRANLATGQSRDEQLRDLATQVEEHRRRVAALEEQLTQERARAAAARSTAERLDRENRDRETRIQALEAELAALKQIDLNRPTTPTRRPQAVPPRN